MAGEAGTEDPGGGIRVTAPRPELQGTTARIKTRPLPEVWTGITEPDCVLCSWSWRDGHREVKVRSEACPVHWRAVPGRAGGRG